MRDRRDNIDRRIVQDRRVMTYDLYSPEKRKCKDRRDGMDRRKNVKPIWLRQKNQKTHLRLIMTHPMDRSEAHTGY